VNLARGGQGAAREQHVGLAELQALGEGARRPRPARLERLDDTGTDGNRWTYAVLWAGHPLKLTSKRLNRCGLCQGLAVVIPGAARVARAAPIGGTDRLLPVGLNRLTSADSGPHSRLARVRALHDITARYNRLASQNPRKWACFEGLGRRAF
jgi:hypothetical protein